MRYHLVGFFTEEQRKGFKVGHRIDFESDSNEEINKKAMAFLSGYNHKYCHSMDFHVTEVKFFED